MKYDRSSIEVGTCYYNNKYCRIYDSELHTTENIFLNEMSFFLKNLLSKNLKLFFINTTYIDCNDILKEDIEFFINNQKLNSNSYKLPYNLKRLRDLQSNDLLYFYDNLFCEMFCIFSEITNNKYHYNLLIAVKHDPINPNFNLDFIYKIKFNLIKIVSIDQIYYNDINYNFMKILFDFDKLKNYNFSNYNEPDYYCLLKNVELHSKNFIECLNYDNFCKKYPNLMLNEFDTVLYNIYVFLLNEKEGLLSKFLDQRIYYSHIFKSFGWHVFILNHEFSDNISYFTSVSSNFAENAHMYKKHTYDYNSIFFLKEVGYIIPIEYSLDFFFETHPPKYFLDLIIDWSIRYQDECFDFTYNISINEISVPRIKYGSSFSQWLKTKKKLLK